MYELDWKIHTFDQLTTKQLYDLLKFRVDIFVVEQKCPYPELDNKDKHIETHHLIGYNNVGDIIAYARLLPPGLSYPEDASMGRFAVVSNMRCQGIGGLLLKACVEKIETLWPDKRIRISAQKHLQKFYTKKNFEKISEPYLEDGIPHIEMLRDL